MKEGRTETDLTVDADGRPQRRLRRLTLDKRFSRWEGIVFLLSYGLVVMEIARLV
jgi:hypothetical protein